MTFTALLNHPLTLIGLVLFAAFGLFKLILTSGLLSTVSGKDSAPILHKLLNYGFVLALCVALSGFGLEAWKIHKQIDRAAQAKKALIGEVLTAVQSLDERLGYVQEIVQTETFSPRLDRIRRNLLPDLADSLGQGYTRLMIQEKLSSLRQMLNSSPLPTSSGHSLMDNLRDSGMDTEPFRLFYAQLAEVERVTEDFIHALSLMARIPGDPSRLRTKYTQTRLHLAEQILSIESQRAYILALILLGQANSGRHAVPLPDSATPILNTLTHLRPRELISRQKAEEISLQLQEELTRLLAQKAALGPMGEQLHQESIQTYQALQARFTIKDSDPPRVVLGKAISLRQFGHRAKAVSAFARYKEMFAPKDPSARQFAHTAQQFTLQMHSLGVNGGVYIFQLVSDSRAEKAGLQPGDIIVQYNGHPTPGMAQFTQATHSAQSGKEVSMTWLRLNAQNHFERHSGSLPGGQLGIGIMPI